MLTFQILDGDQTRYRPLDDCPLVLGSADDADIRLQADGVAPHHARIETVAGNGEDTTFKLVDLDSGSPTLVNGERIAQVRVGLGDRVEIGGAVLVLGRRVSRPATPDDVLDAAPRRSRRPQQRSGSRLGVGLLVAVVIAAVGLWWLNRDDKPPGTFRDQAVHRQEGRFGEARQLLTALRSQWAGSNPQRRALVEQAEAELEASEQAVADLRTRLANSAPKTSFAEQLDELKALSAGGGPTAEAADILRGELMELRRTAIAAAGGRSVPEHVAAGSEKNTPKPDPAKEPETVTPPTETVDPEVVAGILESADALIEDRQWGQAYEVLRQALASVPVASSPPLRERLNDVRDRARTETEHLVNKAQLLVRKGARSDAIAFLEEHAPRFPASGELAGIATEIRSLEVEERAANAKNLLPKQPAFNALAAASKGDSHVLLGELLEAIRSAESASDFAAARQLLEAAAKKVDGEDATFAARLRGQANDMAYLTALQELVRGHTAAGGSVEIPLRGGDAGHIRGMAENNLLVEKSVGERVVRWMNLPPEAGLAMVKKLDAEPNAWLGAAVLAYRGGERHTAETCLAHALRADADLQQVVDGVIRRGRGTRPDPKGYRLVKGRFVAVREIESAELARKLTAQLKTALRGNAARRQAFLDDVMKRSPEALDGLLVALKGEQVGVVERIEKHGFKKRVWDKLALQRDDLDAARKYAKDLIYDEEKYFYPFKPPAVSAEKASEYWPVQKEVDARVSSLRDLWKRQTVKGRVPGNLLGDVERYRWLKGVLVDFGEHDHQLEQRVAWVATLPIRGELTLQNFCRTPDERRNLDLYERIVMFNQLVADHLGSGEQRQLEVTNAYRVMFGHRPLAVNPKVQRAARGHSEEMSKLGYFGHFSPVPGRRTPYDRMRLEEYNMGVSENCAINGSAEGAHIAWLHSAGHHRNLLRASHREFGVGNSGRYWTQNFGSGEEYLQHELFPPAQRD